MKKLHKVTKKITVPAGGTVEVKRLQPQELLELQLRLQTVSNARNTLLMVEEAYQARVASTLTAHGCTGKFDIDMRTGILIPKSEAK
jgi:hypothetical protein